jgi:hypothetical protein
MKTKKIELDVDFIGGDKPLTAKEEKELSTYFKNAKQKARKSILHVPKKRKSLAKV